MVTASLEGARRVVVGLVLDVSLPGLSGLDLQKIVAAEGSDMPIIFITGYGDVPMTVQATKAGAVEFLTKPFDDEVLLSAIRNAIERSHSCAASKPGWSPGRVSVLRGSAQEA